MDDDFDNALGDVVVFFLALLGVGVLLTPLLFSVWFNSPASNALREWAGMPQATAKPVKTKTIPCKILDDETGTKECKIKLDDGRTVTCIVDGDDKSCDWRHAN